MGNGSSQELESDNCKDDVDCSSKDEQLARREGELSQVEKILKMREDACIEKEIEITLREQELESRKRAIHAATERQKTIDTLEAWVKREEETKARGRGCTSRKEEKEGRGRTLEEGSLSQAY